MNTKKSVQADSKAKYEKHIIRSMNFKTKTTKFRKIEVRK